MVNVRLRDPEVSDTHWGRPSGDSFTNFVISEDGWIYQVSLTCYQWRVQGRFSEGARNLGGIVNLLTDDQTRGEYFHLITDSLNTQTRAIWNYKGRRSSGSPPPPHHEVEPTVYFSVTMHCPGSVQSNHSGRGEINTGH